MARTDVFIVGGGPAGLAAGIAARQKGFRVTVADAAIPPADKACGEGLMPDALAALSALGVSSGAADSFPFWGVRFLDQRTSVEAKFPQGCGRGVRRTTLHRILIEHAQAVGVQMHWGAQLDLNRLDCRWLIGADGENSLVRRWAGLDERIFDRRRFGFRRHYQIEPWSDYMELYWGRNCQVYVTPVASDTVCVATISRDSKLRLDAALYEFPALQRRLESAPKLSSERGSVTASRRLQRVYRGHVALVGDASGSVDAITGEGLCLAFRQAAALADALESGDLAAYQRQHRKIARRPQWMARVLLSLGDHAVARRIALLAMQAQPKIFSALLAAHVGAFHEIHLSDFARGRSRIAGPGDGRGIESGSDARGVHAE